MNRADTFEGPTRKPEPLLKTSPVGPPATITSSPSLAPAALYKVDRSAWLSATHHGDAGPASSPQAFRRFGSTTVFGTPLLETSGVTSYALSSEFLCAAATWGASKQAMDTNAITKTTFLPIRADAEALATDLSSLRRTTGRCVNNRMPESGEVHCLVGSDGWRRRTARSRRQSISAGAFGEPRTFRTMSLAFSFDG